MDKLISISEAKQLIQESDEPNKTFRISLHGRIVTRFSQHKIMIQDSSGSINLSIYNRANVLLRSGEKLSFVNLSRKRKSQSLCATFATSIERLQCDEAEKVKNISFIPEQTISSKDLISPSLNKIIIEKLFLKIFLVNAPQKCYQTKQHYQEITCHDNDNVVTIRLQGSLLTRLLATKLEAYNYCMVQDFYIMEKYELNFKVRVIENMSTFRLLHV